MFETLHLDNIGNITLYKYTSLILILSVYEGLDFLFVYFVISSDRFIYS